MDYDLWEIDDEAGVGLEEMLHKVKTTDYCDNKSQKEEILRKPIKKKNFSADFAEDSRFHKPSPQVMKDIIGPLGAISKD